MLLSAQEEPLQPLTERTGTYVVFLLLRFTFISFCIAGRLPLSIVCGFLGLQKFCNQIWTVQVVFWLPRVIFPATQAHENTACVSLRMQPPVKICWCLFHLEGCMTTTTPPRTLTQRSLSTWEDTLLSLSPPADSGPFPPHTLPPPPLPLAHRLASCPSSQVKSSCSLIGRKQEEWADTYWSWRHPPWKGCWDLKLKSVVAAGVNVQWQFKMLTIVWDTSYFVFSHKGILNHSSAVSNIHSATLWTYSIHSSSTHTFPHKDKWYREIYVRK